LRAWAFEFKKDFWTNPVTAVDFLATIPPILSFFDIVYRGSPVFRFLRLLRVLRLLRLLDRSPDSVLFGLVRSDSMSIQLVGIGFEFVCIFIIAAGVIYDLEYTVNPNVNNLNDTLYWAILTLTGIGQPFEVVTAGGRVATVLSIAVALIVVPGQLAKLATVASTQDMMRRYDEEMGEDDSYDENEPLRSGIRRSRRAPADGVPGRGNRNAVRGVRAADSNQPAAPGAKKYHQKERAKTRTQLASEEHRNRRSRRRWRRCASSPRTAQIWRF